MNICVLCKKEFLNSQNRNRRRCPSCNTRVRRMRNKLAAINLLGGKCIDCGWQGLPAGFDFHHEDPNQKEFAIGSVCNKSWESIKLEVMKCVLLCRNCHSIRHSKHDDILLMEEVTNYRGSNKELCG